MLFIIKRIIMSLLNIMVKDKTTVNLYMFNNMCRYR